MIQIFHQNFEYWVATTKYFLQINHTLPIKLNIASLDYIALSIKIIWHQLVCSEHLSTSDNGIELSMLTDDDEKKKNPGRPSKQCGFGCILSLVYTYIHIHNMYTYICYDSNI